MVWIRRDLKDNLYFIPLPLCLPSSRPCAQITSSLVLNTFGNKGTTAISSWFIAVNVCMNVINPQPLINFNSIQLQSIFFHHHLLLEKTMLSKKNFLFFTFLSLCRQSLSKSHCTHPKDIMPIEQIRFHTNCFCSW